MNEPISYFSLFLCQFGLSFCLLKPKEDLTTTEMIWELSLVMCPNMWLPYPGGYVDVVNPTNVYIASGLRNSVGLGHVIILHPVACPILSPRFLQVPQGFYFHDYLWLPIDSVLTHPSVSCVFPHLLMTWRRTFILFLNPLPYMPKTTHMRHWEHGFSQIFRAV